MNVRAANDKRRDLTVFSRNAIAKCFIPVISSLFRAISSTVIVCVIKDTNKCGEKKRKHLYLTVLCSNRLAR